MFSLHHVHLMASDIEATIAFWREHFGAVILLDAEFAGARNVFLRIGEGRLHLYAQPQACYAMAQGPDGLLLELFQPDAAQMDRRLADARYFASVSGRGGGRSG